MFASHEIGINVRTQCLECMVLYSELPLKAAIKIAERAAVNLRFHTSVLTALASSQIIYVIPMSASCVLMRLR